MMNITLRSKVQGELTEIYKQFDERLFEYLLPPGAKLIAFGGSRQGDIVHLKLPLAGEWISEITEDGATEDMCYFIDEGRTLPFPLKKWRHKHVLQRVGLNTIIEDNINFSTGSTMTNLLFYPILYLSFLPRVWQYKRYFTRR